MEEEESTVSYVLLILPFFFRGRKSKGSTPKKTKRKSETPQTQELGMELTSTQPEPTNEGVRKKQAVLRMSNLGKYTTIIRPFL